MKIKQIEVSPDQQKVMIVFDLGGGSAEMFNLATKALYKMCLKEVADEIDQRNGPPGFPDAFKNLFTNLSGKKPE